MFEIEENGDAVESRLSSPKAVGAGINVPSKGKTPCYVQQRQSDHDQENK